MCCGFNIACHHFQRPIAPHGVATCEVVGCRNIGASDNGKLVDELLPSPRSNITAVKQNISIWIETVADVLQNCLMV